jgi:ribosomal-protein-alanine N-acetyltransferase
MLTINFNPFPQLKSDLLLLRRITTGDAAQILALRGNPETMKYITRPLLTSHHEVLEFIKTRVDTLVESNHGIDWAVTLNGNPQMIGTAGIYHIQPENFRAEIGYMLLPEYQNKGIITETIKLMLDYAFHQLQMHSVQAVIDPANIASERVLQKNGFAKEAHLIENEYHNGVFYDSVIYSLLKRNYKPVGK